MFDGSTTAKYLAEFVVGPIGEFVVGKRESCVNHVVAVDFFINFHELIKSKGILFDSLV